MGEEGGEGQAVRAGVDEHVHALKRCLAQLQPVIDAAQCMRALFLSHTASTPLARQQPAGSKRYAPMLEGPQVNDADEGLIDNGLRVQPRQHALQLLRHQPRLVVGCARQHLDRGLAHMPARQPA